MALRVPKAQIPAELRSTTSSSSGSFPNRSRCCGTTPRSPRRRSSRPRRGRGARRTRASRRPPTWPSGRRSGCSWCLDVNYFLALDQDLDPVKASQVPRWPVSEVFTPLELERVVLVYAEAMTNTPTTVTDELVASLLDRLGPAALVELTVLIGFANLSTRCNTAHGITSQGYSDAWEIPLAEPSENTGLASRT